MINDEGQWENAQGQTMEEETMEAFIAWLGRMDAYQARIGRGPRTKDLDLADLWEAFDRGVEPHPEAGGR